MTSLPSMVCELFLWCLVVRLKEQLIKELGKNSYYVKEQNLAYAKRIQSLEQVVTYIQYSIVTVFRTGGVCIHFITYTKCVYWPHSLSHLAGVIVS